MRRIRLLSALFLTTVFLISYGFSAETGRIEGIVTLPNGDGLGGVSIIVSGVGAYAVSDSDGRYALQDLPVGTYAVTFSLGDNQVTVPDVAVAADQATMLDREVDWEVSFVESITVYSASRRRERVVDAPAAVTSLTREEIERRSSSSQVPKLLEFTPGTEVTQSGLYDYNLNTRGFNSSLNRRVAVLIDGRNPAVPFLGAQEWAAVSFPSDDFAGVEFVRGPSASLYGANASSGVLNMITTGPKETEGGFARVTAGELGTTNLDFRWAEGLGNEWYVKVTGGIRDHGDFTVSRVGEAEYSTPCPVPQGSAIDCLPQEAVPLELEDDDQVIFGSVRFDKHLQNGHVFTVEGGQAEIEGPVFQTGIGRVQVLDADRPWARLNYTTHHFNFLGYYNERNAPRQLALASGANLALDTMNYQFEGQTFWNFAGERGRIVAGGLVGREEIDSVDPATGMQTAMFEPVETDKTAGYVQIDWTFNDHLKGVVAGRYDDSDLHDSQVSPKAALVFSFNRNHKIRLTYNEAFQVPNYSEFFLQAPVMPAQDLSAVEPICTSNASGPVNCGFGNGATPILGLGNEDLELEEVKTVELGYSAIIGGKAYLTIDYYNSKNENFITDLLPQLGTSLGRINPNFGPYQAPAALDPANEAALLATLQGALGPSYAILSNNLDGAPIFAAVSYTNFGEVDTQGADLSLIYQFNESWSGSLGYSWFDFEIQEELPGFEEILLPNSPETKYNAGVAYKQGRWEAALDYRWVDTFRWVVGPFQGDVESYGTADLAGSFAFTDHWKAGIYVSNVFDEGHWEAFGGDLLERRALGYITASW